MKRLASDARDGIVAHRQHKKFNPKNSQYTKLL